MSTYALFGSPTPLVLTETGAFQYAYGGDVISEIFAPPVVTAANFTFTAPQAAGYVVGTLTATNSPTSWAITAGDPAGDFAIDASGIITTAIAIANVAGTETLTVTATNADGTSPDASSIITWTATVSALAVGWPEERKRRRIPIEQLREILKEQGSPWADELADTVKAVESRPVKSKKHQEVVEEIVEEVAELARTAPMDWGPTLKFLHAAEDAHRTTLIIKNGQAALRAMRDRLQAQDDDDEEAIRVLMDAWMK